jgi:hypothetical protein
MRLYDTSEFTSLLLHLASRLIKVPSANADRHIDLGIKPTGLQVSLQRDHNFGMPGRFGLNCYQWKIQYTTQTCCNSGICRTLQTQIYSNLLSIVATTIEDIYTQRSHTQMAPVVD